MRGARLVHVSFTRAGALTPDAIAEDETLLQPDERERANRFHFERDRRMYIGAHALLRRALSRHAPVDPAAWRFVASEHGRPEIGGPAGAPRLRFSLSHTRGIAACAVAAEIDIGFDVEDAAREAPLEVARRFAPSEIADLSSLPAGEREERFFVYWTLKEAYVKARGLGLAIPLDEFAFDLSAPNIRVSFGSGCVDDEKLWRFESWLIDGAHRAALAMKSGADVEIQVSSG
jgi:4'-phosphopantetheinyl transferase